MAAEQSKRQFITSLMTVFLFVGLILIAVAGMVWSWSLVQGDPAAPNPPITTWDRNNLQNVWAPIFWDAGMVLLILGIWSMAMMRQDMDPMARLLMYLVSFILILLVFVAPSLMFRGVP